MTLPSSHRNRQSKRKHTRQLGKNFSLVSTKLDAYLEKPMLESSNLNPELSNLSPESSLPSNIPTKDLPQPNIPTNTNTTDMLEPTTNTRRGRPKKENPISHQNANIPISASSPTSEEEELDPLTPKQEKLRKKYEGMYTGLGGLTFGVRPYAGMAIMRYAKERSEELIRMARHYPFLYKWLEYFADSSDTMAFLVGHGVMLWAILSEAGTLKGNPAIFNIAGLNPEQVMAPPPNMPMMSEEELHAYSAATNGNRGN